MHAMHQFPTVTIAIPTYNRVAYLHQAIQSALSQTYSNIQVIISDNCSEDGTAEYVSSLRDQRLLFLPQQRNLGMSGNWNACLAQATGEFFLLLSDDDFLEEEAIEKLVAAVVKAERPEQVGLAYCRIWEVDEESKKVRIGPVPPKLEDAREFAMQYFRLKRKLQPCATLFRTGDIKAIGGYTQGTVTLAIDAMVWSRILLTRGAIAGVAEPLANYRIHLTNTVSSSRIQLWQGEIRTFAKLWLETLKDSPTRERQQFIRAVRGYEGCVIAAFINQSARSWPGRIRAIGVYYRCRASFAGASGKINLLGGIGQLLMPEVLKRPIRKLLLWARY